jgi:hypothetical protein
MTFEKSLALYHQIPDTTGLLAFVFALGVACILIGIAKNIPS